MLNPMQQLTCQGLKPWSAYLQLWHIHSYILHCEALHVGLVQGGPGEERVGSGCCGLLHFMTCYLVDGWMIREGCAAVHHKRAWEPRCTQLVLVLDRPKLSLLGPGGSGRSAV